MSFSKNVLLLITLLISSASFSQTWNHVGALNSIGTAEEMDFVIAPNGEMYVMYKDTATQLAHVKTWNGTAWELVGPAGFGGTLSTDYKIEAMSDGTPVIAWKTSSGNDRIRVFSWNGTIWEEYGNLQFLTQLFYDYDITIDGSDNVSLSYFNSHPSIGPANNQLWLEITTSGQNLLGGGFTNTIGQTYSSISIATSNTPADHWALFGGITPPKILLRHYDGVTTFQDAPGGGIIHPNYSLLNSEAEVRSVNGSDKFVAIWKENNTPTNPLYMRYYDCATDVYSAPLYISANVIASDMAVASDGFAYTMDEHATYGMTKVDLSTMIPTTYAVDFISGTPTIDNPKVDTENGIIVVAWINQTTKQIEVHEEDNPVTVTSAPDFTICSGGYHSTNGFTLNDNNYDHSNISFTPASGIEAVISNGSLLIGGSYPNYTFEFPTDFEPTNNIVDLYSDVLENGIYVTQFTLDVNVLANIDISSTDASTTLCKNAGFLNLTPFGSPGGGTWSGPGVNNNKFYPSVANTGTHNIIYTKTSLNGCINKDTSIIIVNSIPSLVMTTMTSTCGNEDGTAAVNINSGDDISNYDVYWSNGESDASLIEDLAVGAYYVNVTDDNGCSAVGQASINSDAYTVTEVLSQINCFGDDDGAIDITITGTTGPYTTVWSNGQITEDLSSLEAGIYDLTITDANGCQATHTYEIIDPGEIFANIEVTSADCGLSNGSLETFPAGGTNPLTFQWFDDGNVFINNTNLISSLPGGMYYIVITDDNGCTKLQNVVLTETGGPIVVIDSIYNVNCVNTGSIFTTINSTATVASINWTNGATTEDVSGLTTGFYALQVEDINGCIGMASAIVTNEQPEDQIICMVTVDENTNTNRVVWEKPITSDISHFNIYRETSVLGNYQFVDSVLYADESFFNDTIASPQIKSWRYKISAVDVCGTEGELSSIHKTIHLVISPGLGGLVNLSWDDYEGFPYATFDIWRNTTLSGWVPVTSLAANEFTYTDDPGTSDGLEYYIAITPPSTCTSTKATDYNSSRSNKSEDSGIVAGLDDQNIDFNIYPNPTRDLVKIELSKLTSDCELEVRDLSGKVVYKSVITTMISTIDVAALSSGVYTVVLHSEDAEIQRILIKQ